MRCEIWLSMGAAEKPCDGRWRRELDPRVPHTRLLWKNRRKHELTPEDLAVLQRKGDCLRIPEGWIDIDPSMCRNIGRHIRNFVLGSVSFLPSTVSEFPIRCTRS